MSLVKWKNKDLFPAFYEMMESFFKDEGDFFSSTWKSTSPAVNVSKTEKAYQLEVAAPGLDKGDFKIEIEKGVLNISAEQKRSKEEKKEQYTRREFSYQSFVRTFQLPEDAEDQGAEAKYENGLLKINIPRKVNPDSNTAKKIEIN